MIASGAFGVGGEKDCFRLPQGWQDRIVSKFEQLEVSPFPERGPYDKDPSVWRERCLPKYSALLKILELVAVHPSTNARIAELLLRKLKLSLRPSTSLASDEVHFIVSQGFHAYLRMSHSAGNADITLSPLLRAAVPRFARSVGFLQAYYAYEQMLQRQDRSYKQDGSSSDGSNQAEDLAVQPLIENLSTSSPDLRLSSIRLLESIGEEASQSAEIVAMMLQIESTPLSADQTRTIAMHLRKLGITYHSLQKESWLQKAVPSFLFGMLTVKLSPVWDDAVECLKQIAQSKVGEDAVFDVAFAWLNVPSLRWTPANEATGQNRPFVSEFECTAMRSDKRNAETIQGLAHDPDEVMRQNFDEKQQTIQAMPAVARSRALKVFNAMPLYAEKRSRLLVPHLLCWASVDDDATFDTTDDLDQPRAATWSLADRKGLLGVFSQFVNPRVLYQHEQVYEAVLQLLENGDGDVQKLALKGILAWKQDGVKPYQENLEYLLDESRFKNEITVFLQGDNVIKSEHRPELMPVLLRLLYGRTISKKGVASGRHGLHATRLTVLRNLSLEDMGNFLDIATGKLRDVRMVDPKYRNATSFDKPLISARRQVGFLNMMMSLISELGTSVTPYVETLLNAVLYCLVFASRQLSGTALGEEDPTDEEDEKASTHSLLKVIRSTGLKCLTSLFRNAQKFQWAAYENLIIEEVVAPRIENLPIETAQGISGILQLLSTWSSMPGTALFLAPHENILPKGALPQIIACISVEKAKDEVKAFALGILRNLITLVEAEAAASEFNEVIKEELLEPNFDFILTSISKVVDQPGISTDLLESCIATTLAIAPLLEEPTQIKTTIQMSISLLQQPPRKVSPKLKGRVLLVVESFVSLPATVKDAQLLDEVFTTLSSLFSYFKDMENRQSLSRALSTIAQGDRDLADIVSLCSGLNSFKEGRIEEPDYDKRLAAFNAISKQRDSGFSPKQWLPLLHNLVYYIRADEEFGILSSNSADGIRRFIQDCADCDSQESRERFEEHLKEIVLPAIHSGARELSATVRREILRVFGFLLSTMPQWPPVAELSGLLGELQEDSAEPSFFFNLLSPATSRQLEALRAIEVANASREMDSQNLGQFFIPLLEHFLFDREDGSDDHGLGAQAATTIGNLAMSLHWKHYRTTLQRYISYIGSRPESQKQTIRLLSSFTDALSRTQKKVEEGDLDAEQGHSSSASDKRLAMTYPGNAQLTSDVVDNFLPTLVKHLHEKDESQVSYRVPVGVIVVKLLQLLSSEQLDQKLAGVLTDISHILRSKSWESREMARDTLVKIAVILGPSFFGFMLRELRGALRRGYQLHVLSYTMHSLLTALAPLVSPGDLDYCLYPVVTVIMDDIFGVIGQEKDAEDYTNQMKEIKSSKSQDSMELVAKNASINRLIDLVKPLQALLGQRVDLKMARKIDTLMARIVSGLFQNSAAESRDTLVFCYEVIQEVYNSKKPQAVHKVDPRVKKYLVQKGAKKSGERSGASKHTYKLVRFAFDILRSIFKKHDSLRNPANVAGFLPILGDAILDGEDEVKISAFRLLAVLVKVPFTNEDGADIYKVAVKEATKSIAMSTSSTTDISQAALKMLAVALRDRKDVTIKDAALDMLLRKVKDDLTEPLFRHVTFNFLRSVLGRQIETAAVYEIMDYVGMVMITNDDKDTRDLARGAFFQFIREYPQKKARWGQQLDFVVANLKYTREGGRLSVMEMVHLLLMKSSEDFVQQISATCFLPLFLSLANDDSEKCRLAATELLKEIFRRSDKERTQNFLSLVRNWMDKQDNAEVQRLALRVFGYYFEAREDAPKNSKDFNIVLDKIMLVLECDDVDEVVEEFAVVAFEVVGVLTTVSPEKMLSSEREDLWTSVIRCLGHRVPSVKLGAIRLVSMYLSDFAQRSPVAAADGQVEGSHGLKLDAERVQALARLAVGALGSGNAEEALAAEAGQVLIFLGPRLPAPASSDSDELSELEGEPGVEQDEAEVRRQPEGLHYLFWRLSHILRKETPARAAYMVPKTTAMEVLETLCRRSSLDRIQASLKAILTPLHHLTDPTIPQPYSTDETFKDKHEALKTRAQILMDSLQKKMGVSEYSKQLLAIRQEVRARRQQRSSKRKIEALAQPEKYGRDKRKKFEKNRERRKVRSKEHKTTRQAYKGW